MCLELKVFDSSVSVTTIFFLNLLHVAYKPNLRCLKLVYLKNKMGFLAWNADG